MRWVSPYHDSHLLLELIAEHLVIFIHSGLMTCISHSFLLLISSRWVSLMTVHRRASPFTSEYRLDSFDLLIHSWALGDVLLSFCSMDLWEPTSGPHLRSGDACSGDTASWSTIGHAVPLLGHHSSGHTATCSLTTAYWEGHKILSSTLSWYIFFIFTAFCLLFSLPFTASFVPGRTLPVFAVGTKASVLVRLTGISLTKC